MPFAPGFVGPGLRTNDSESPYRAIVSGSGTFPVRPAKCRANESELVRGSQRRQASPKTANRHRRLPSPSLIPRAALWRQNRLDDCQNHMYERAIQILACMV